MMRKRGFCVCGYEGRSDYVKRTHEPNCKAKMKIESLQNELEDLKTKFLHESINLHNLIQVKNEKIQDLYSDLQKANENVLRLTKQKTSHTINNVLNINVKPFGSEPDIDKQVVLSMLKNPSNSIPQYIEMKHFKKGQNIKIQNIRSNQLQVIEEHADGKRWVHRDKMTTLNHLVDFNLDELLEKYSADHVCKAWKIWYESNNLHKDDYINTPEFRRIVKEVECILINYR